MKQKKNRSMVFGGVALVVLCVGAVLMMFGLSNAISEIRDKSISRTPEAILASAGVSEEELVSVPVIYYDWQADECVSLYDLSLSEALYTRQFEWSSCGYYNKEIEKGLVEFDLGEDYLPVASGTGKLTSNRGADVPHWFKTKNDKNKSYNGTLGVRYQADRAEFVFESEDFYPLDEVEFGDDYVNKDGHNHLFAMSFAVPFRVLLSGEEEFTVVADDDTFVFVGSKLVLDMGGIHDAARGRFIINEDGEVYAGVEEEDLAYTGVNVANEEGSIVRVYHADRDSDSSVFNMKFSGMNLSLTNAEIADGGGIQIAYDPSDPTYIAPLGESSVFRPDSTKGLLAMATIEGLMVIVIAVLVVSVARFMVKQKVQK